MTVHYYTIKEIACSSSRVVGVAGVVGVYITMELRRSHAPEAACSSAREAERHRDSRGGAAGRYCRSVPTTQHLPAPWRGLSCYDGSYPLCDTSGEARPLRWHHGFLRRA